MDKEAIISEIRRVANALNADRLSIREFKLHSKISPKTVEYQFGSWNEAVRAAGLTSTDPGPQVTAPRRTDEEYLLEIVRLTSELGRVPTAALMNAKGRFSDAPYRERWGGFRKACEAAYAQYGPPSGRTEPDLAVPEQYDTRDSPPQVVLPTTIKPPVSVARKKVQFGEPIDFRGLRFAPVNEDGVIFVFGMICRELGFLIESIRPEYPDCEGKRRVDKSGARWEHVLIEFEYRSGNFKDHGHDASQCDLIVCWIHDWAECPVEVLELRSQLKYLPKG